MRVRVEIPNGVTFADLHLRRDAVTREVSFQWAPIEAICEASGINIDVLRRGPEDNVSALLVEWYRRHRAAGGEIDLVAEQLFDEVAAEDAHGTARVQSGGGVQ